MLFSMLISYGVHLPFFLILSVWISSFSLHWLICTSLRWNIILYEFYELFLQSDFRDVRCNGHEYLEQLQNLHLISLFNIMLFAYRNAWYFRIFAFQFPLKLNKLRQSLNNPKISLQNYFHFLYRSDTSNTKWGTSNYLRWLAINLGFNVLPNSYLTISINVITDFFLNLKVFSILLLFIYNTCK